MGKAAGASANGDRSAAALVSWTRFCAAKPDRHEGYKGPNQSGRALLPGGPLQQTHYGEILQMSPWQTNPQICMYKKRTKNSVTQLTRAEIAANFISKK